MPRCLKLVHKIVIIESYHCKKVIAHLLIRIIHSESDDSADCIFLGGGGGGYWKKPGKTLTDLFILFDLWLHNHCRVCFAEEFWALALGL